MLKIIVSKDREIVMVFADSYGEVRTATMARADIVVIRGVVVKNRFV